MAFLLSLEGIQRRDLDTGAKLFAALEGVGSFVYEVQSSITKESAQQ